MLFGDLIRAKSNMNCINIYLVLIYVLVLLLNVGCFGSKISISNKKKSLPKTENSQVSISSVKVLNHQIVITGKNLSDVSDFKIKEGGITKNLQIESQTSTSIIANTLSNVTFSAGKVFDFVFSSAEAASTFTVDFSLCDSTLGGKGFSCSITPNDKEVLSYDANSGKWKPRAVNGLSYQGSWDATTIEPSTSTEGNYFIVSVANPPYQVGDWIVFNGTTYDRIDNSQTITSVFGRTGVITSLEGDYILTKMGDVDLTTIAPVNGNFLKFNGVNWVAGTAVTAESDPTVSAFAKAALPTCNASEVLKSNGTAFSCVTDLTGSGGGVTSISSANSDIGVSGTTTPVLTLNSGTSANQIVKLTAASKLPAVDGSLLTLLNPASLSSAVAVAQGGTGLTAGTSGGIPYFNTTSTMATSALLGLNSIMLGGGAGGAPSTLGAGTAGQVLTSGGAGTAPAWISSLPIANGGTGGTSLATAQSALGIVIGGATTGSAAIVGTGGVVANKMCSGDSSGGGISCVNTTSSFLAGTISDETGTGVLVFGSAPTITNPIIANIAPGADFTITQNAVIPFRSLNSSAAADTLVLNSGSVGIGNASPRAALDVSGAIVSKAPVDIASSVAVNFASNNLQYTTTSCGAFTLSNMVSGGTYTLAVQGGAATACSFTAAGFTVHTGAATLTPTATKHILFTFLVMGTHVYVASVDGF